MAVDFVSQWLMGINEPALTLAGLLLDVITYPILFIIWVAMIQFKWEKHKIKSLLLAGLILIVLVEGVKILVAQPRPCDIVAAKMKCPSDPSFPSGHAAFTALFLPVFLGTPFFWLYFVFYLLVSISRIYLGVHVLIDIVAGTTIGMAAYLIVDRLLSNRWDKWK